MIVQGLQFSFKIWWNSDLTSSTGKECFKSVKEIGSMSDVTQYHCFSISRSTSTITALYESAAGSPRTFIRHRAQEIDISKSSLQHTIRKIFTFKLTQSDFVDNWSILTMHNEGQVDIEFPNKIIFSDQDHFDLDCLNNTQ